MRNMSEIDKRDYPIGTFPQDFHKLCKDCLRTNDIGEYAFRAVHYSVNKSEVKEEKCVGRDGRLHITHAYALEPEDYCYYHMKKRGLLPYQKGKKTMSVPNIL